MHAFAQDSLGLVSGLYEAGLYITSASGCAVEHLPEGSFVVTADDMRELLKPLGVNFIVQMLDEKLKRRPQ
jgi:hypothetical protein